MTRRLLLLMSIAWFMIEHVRPQQNPYSYVSTYSQPVLISSSSSLSVNIFSSSSWNPWTSSDMADGLRLSLTMSPPRHSSLSQTECGFLSVPLSCGVTPFSVSDIQGNGTTQINVTRRRSMVKHMEFLRQCISVLACRSPPQLSTTYTVTWTVVLNGYETLNGHFYQYLGDDAYTSLTYSAAKQNCSSLPRIFNMPGYLVTLTSESENALFPGKPFWMCAEDASVEGEWKWMCGPESGTLFYDHNIMSCLTYCNWGENEPNDGTFISEDLADRLPSGKWEDSKGYTSYSYVCEWGGSQPSVSVNGWTTLTPIIVTTQPPTPVPPTDSPTVSPTTPPTTEPPTTAPPTTAPPTTAPPTTAPPTTAPPTTAPPTTAPPTTAPPTTEPPTTAPPTTSSPTTAPPTTAPPATEPPTTAPPTTAPPTTAPPTTAPPTTAPPTTAPPTTASPTTAPPTTAPPTTAAPTTAPPTTAPPTTAPATTAPPTTAPPTTAPPTTAPPTTPPTTAPTTAPPTTAPTTAPPTTAPPTTAPPTTVPPTTAPPTTAPPTTAPPTTAPPTTVPPTTAPPATASPTPSPSKSAPIPSSPPQPSPTVTPRPSGSTSDPYCSAQLIGSSRFQANDVIHGFVCISLNLTKCTISRNGTIQNIILHNSFDTTLEFQYFNQTTICLLPYRGYAEVTSRTISVLFMNNTLDITIEPDSGIATLFATANIASTVSDSVTVASCLLVSPTQAAAQQTSSVLSMISCGGLDEVQRASFTPVPLPIEHVDLRGVLSNTLLFAASWAVLRLSTHVIAKLKYGDKFMNAAVMVGYPHWFLVLFGILLQGSIFHSWRLLFTATNAAMYFVSFVGVAMYSFVTPVIVWWFHRYRFDGRFRPYVIIGAPWRRKLFFEGVWGPKHVYERSATFISNFKPNAVVLCWIPLVLTSTVCVVAAFPMSNKSDCCIQYIIESVLLFLTGLFFVWRRPLRWWVLNYGNGLIYMFQTCSMALHAAHTSMDDHNNTNAVKMTMWEGYIALCTSCCSTIVSIACCIAVMVEIGFMKKRVWGNVDTEDDTECTMTTDMLGGNSYVGEGDDDRFMMTVGNGTNRDDDVTGSMSFSKTMRNRIIAREVELMNQLMELDIGVTQDNVGMNSHLGERSNDMTVDIKRFQL